MATFFIYCPCKVHEVGVARISHGPEGKSVYPYILWGEIQDKTKRAACKFCGETVRILGDNPEADRLAGISKRKARRLVRRELREARKAGE